MAIFSSLQAATNITLVIKQVFTVEENNSLKAEAKSILASDSALNTLVNQFETDIKAITTKAALKTRAQTAGLAIFNHAVTKNQSVQDDRPLYWARNRMNYLLKDLMNTTNALNDNSILSAFESKSRGFNDVNFSGLPAGTKKILITGYDPFQLNNNMKQSNPSGASALLLHNQTLVKAGKTGKVQVAIMPVRYGDFDRGLVDTFFNKYFLGTDKVDMIITLSQGSPNRYDVERFAAKFRDYRKTDNLNIQGGSATFYVPSFGTAVIAASTVSLPEFIETELPTNKMVPGTYSNSKTIYNQKWITGKVTGPRFGIDEVKYHERLPSVHTDPNTDSGNSPIVDYPSEPSLEGSGQNYLSNEIFYRVALLRTKHASTVKTGHIHVPNLSQGTSDMDKYRTSELVFKVKEMIEDALSGL